MNFEILIRSMIGLRRNCEVSYPSSIFSSKTQMAQAHDRTHVLAESAEHSLIRQPDHSLQTFSGVQFVFFAWDFRLGTS